MHEEETAHNRVLWQCYTDAELAGVHDALVASISARNDGGGPLDGALHVAY